MPPALFAQLPHAETLGDLGSQMLPKHWYFYLYLLLKGEKCKQCGVQLQSLLMLLLRKMTGTLRQRHHMCIEQGAKLSAVLVILLQCFT